MRLIIYFYWLNPTIHSCYKDFGEDAPPGIKCLCWSTSWRILIKKLLRKYKKMNEKRWQTLSKMLIHFYHFRDQTIILPGGLKLRWNEVDSRHR